MTSEDIYNVIKADIEPELDKNTENRVQIYFKKDSELYKIDVATCDSITIEDGFLKAHDTVENKWHCYNLDIISHFHYSDKWRKINDQGKH